MVLWGLSIRGCVVFPHKLAKFINFHQDQLFVGEIGLPKDNQAHYEHEGEHCFGKQKRIEYWAILDRVVVDDYG